MIATEVKHSIRLKMKKWYLITAAVLLLVGYIILPSGTPAEEVKSWLASECTVIAVFYFLFSSYKWDETDS